MIATPMKDIKTKTAATAPFLCQKLIERRSMSGKDFSKELTHEEELKAEDLLDGAASDVASGDCETYEVVIALKSDKTKVVAADTAIGWVIGLAAFGGVVVDCVELTLSEDVLERRDNLNEDIQPFKALIYVRRLCARRACLES